MGNNLPDYPTLPPAEQPAGRRKEREEKKRKKEKKGN
jgi:hypothetical protein